MWEVPLYAGARYTFAGYRTDLYWGLLGEARYVGADDRARNRASSTTTVPT